MSVSEWHYFLSLFFYFSSAPHFVLALTISSKLYPKKLPLLMKQMVVMKLNLEKKKKKQVFELSKF